MAWQDDKDNDSKQNPKDPWTDNRDPNGPPDLEQAIRKLFKNLKKPSPNQQQNRDIPPTTGGTRPSGESPFYALFGLVVIVLAALWAISGIFIVAPQQQAVVLRFGAYHTTLGPGPHWIPRFIDSSYIVSVEDVMDYQYNAEMLTRDENIVSVGIAIQYRIGDAQNYLFRVVNPKESLAQITTSVLRQVIGDKKLDEVLNYGLERNTGKDITTSMGHDINVAVSELLKNYQTGIIVTDVAIQFIKPPAAVIEAFDDVIIAGEDRVRYRSEAEADAQKMVLEAEGIAERITAEARAIAQNHIAKAKTKTAEFLGELPQYKMTPNITRERLYLDAMSSILGKNPKIFITAKENNSNNMFYMPLDKIMENQGRKTTQNTSDSSMLPQALQFNRLPESMNSLSENSRQPTRSVRDLNRGQ